MTKKNCALCGIEFVPSSGRQKFCTEKHAARSLYLRNKNKPPRPIADDDLISRILSDSIFSGAIRGELESLRALKSRAVASLQKVLQAELAFPTWPNGRLARAALALCLLRDNPSHGRFRHPHEKPTTPGHYKPSGVVIGRGGARIR